jgi:hypothetical protein
VKPELIGTAKYDSVILRAALGMAIIKNRKKPEGS